MRKNEWAKILEELDKDEREHPYVPDIEDRQFIVDLINDVPELKPMLDNHISLDDEILPYVFLESLRDKFCKSLLEGSANKNLIFNTLVFIEKRFGIGNNKINSMIQASFIEYMFITPGGKQLVQMLGPKLGAEQIRQDGS